MLVPKVSNLDLGRGRKAIFRGGGENDRKRTFIIFLVSLRFGNFTEEGKRRKGTWGLYEVNQSREKARRKLSHSDES